MIEHGVIKIGSAKFLGLVVAPGIALIGVSSYLAWKLWKTKNNTSEQATEDETKVGEVIVTSTSQSTKSHGLRDAMFRQIIDENVELRHAT